MVLSLSEMLLRTKTKIQIKGTVAGADSLVCAASWKNSNKTFLVVLHDRDEARAFHFNLSQLPVKRDAIKIFPSSYKKPYQYDEVENANVLQRSEVLASINQNQDNPHLIVTYPEALSEKVINRRSLVDNTFSANKGDQLDTAFLEEFLYSYEFEKVDFVYEPGQFAVRGGIVDVFSFSGEMPYRIELFGDSIESIREFDPETQLSQNSLEKMNIIPDVQNKLIQEERQSFLKYLPSNAVLWFKDIRETLDITDRCFDKAEETFKAIKKSSGDVEISSPPDLLFETRNTLEKDLYEFNVIEFGKRFQHNENKVEFEFKPQPSFNKNFEILIDDLKSFSEKEFELFIVCDSAKQIERFQTIFEDTNSKLQFNGVVSRLNNGFIDLLDQILVYTDHQIFERYHQITERRKFTNKKALTLKELQSLQTGDFVVHVDYGVGRFAGLEEVDANGKAQEALRIVFKDDDLLYISVHSLHKISKYSGKEGEPPSISKLGGKEWQNKKKRVKKKVKDIAKDLIALYAKRKSAPGFAFPKDDYLQVELESSFMYEDTPDQSMATSDVKADMELQHPMDRLVCGDVGFGKTEVAIRAAFKAVNSGKQVAILVPTTILAMQHFQTFSKRLENFPVEIDYINRFKSTKDINQTKKLLREGKIDILIGTHRIINKDIQFSDLGLLVIDEEQKFGVKAKERIKEMRVNVDALTLTATPIPRTLHFSLMGARDLSIISTPPPNRRPVKTEVQEFSDEIIRDAISHEMRRNGQVFFVHNRIGDIENLANRILKLVPEANIGIAHGQMEGERLEKVMMKFITGEYDVLVSTNIIESGLDIPNANTIIINRANMFGLSDLHQMRGRVGRSNTQAYCYLLTADRSTLTSEARKRLIALEEFSDLGDGFKVAMRDLDIRGAGNLLGSEQSGFINDMGFDMYHKILEEAVQELKENEFKELFQNEILTEENLKKLSADCIIETDLEILIPQEYVSNTSERLQLYSRLDNLKEESELIRFRTDLQDRFGSIPSSVDDLISSVRLRWLGQELGLEKIVLKNSIMKCYVSESQDDSYFQGDVFGGLVGFVQKNPKISSIKDYKGKLIVTFRSQESIEQAMSTLNDILSIPAE